MKKNIYWLFLPILTFLMLQGCFKEEDYNFNKLAKGNYEPTLAVPLVYSSMTMQNILDTLDKKHIIQADADNFLTLFYRSNVFTAKAEDIFLLNNQTIANASVSLGASEITTLQNSGSVTKTFSSVLDYTSAEELYQIDFKKGQMVVNITSTYKHSGNIELTFNEIKKNGTALKVTIPITYSGSLPVNTSKTVDITGYSADLTNGGSSYNKINVQIALTLNNSGNSTLLTDKIDFKIDLKNMGFSYLEGYLGQKAINTALDSIYVKVYNQSFKYGTLEFENPKVHLYITNSFGMPFSASFPTLKTVSKINGTTNINLPVIYNPLNITAAPSKGNFSQQKISLDNTNSNVKTAINKTLEYAVYQLNTLSNAAGKTKNFVVDTSRINVDGEIELPFYSIAKNFTLQDTLGFDFDMLMDEEIKWANFRIFIENGFPLEAKVQVYFVNNTYAKIDSLIKPYDQIIIPAAPVNSNGRVTQMVSKTTDILIEQTRLKNIKNAKYVIVKSHANSLNNGATNVKIYGDYKLNISLGVQTKLSIGYGGN